MDTTEHVYDKLVTVEIGDHTGKKKGTLREFATLTIKHDNNSSCFFMPSLEAIEELLSQAVLDVSAIIGAKDKENL